MATEQPSDQMFQAHHAKVVKEEPPEEQPELTSFCYDTVTKEEVIVEDEVEHVDGQPAACFGTRSDHERTHKRGTNKSQSIQDIGENTALKEDSSIDSTENVIKEDKSEESDQSNDGDLAESPTEKIIEGNGPFKCSQCNRTYDRAAYRSRCERKHEIIKQELFKCKVCGKLSSSKSNLAQHERTHEREKNKIAENILSDDEDQTGNLADLVIEQNGIFKCSECEREFKHRKRAVKCAKQHLTKRNNLNTERSYKCAECNKSFGVGAERNDCMKRHYALKLGLYECEVCKKCFGTEENHANHMATHKKKTIKEKHAGDILKDTLQEEIEIVRQENGLFKCAKCNRMYKQQHLAEKCTKRHLAMRLGLYQCKFCNLSAGNFSDLIKHELRHKEELAEQLKSSPLSNETATKEKNSSEDQSDSASKSSSGHPTKISEQHPFQCSVCHRAFDKVFDLNACERKHEVIQLGLHKCKVCGKCFSANANLRIHERIHKKETKESRPDENIPGLEQRIFKPEDPDVSNSNNLIGGCTSYELKEHKNTYLHKSETEERAYECDLCKKCFKTKLAISIHMKFHIKGGPQTSVRQIKKEPIEGNEIVHLKRRQTEPEQASEEGSKESSHPNENNSSFCYETVMKEELIIEDDAFGDSAEEMREEDSRNSLEDYHIIKDEALQDGDSFESLQEQSESTEGEGIFNSKLSKNDHHEQQSASNCASNQVKCDLCQKIFAKKRNLEKHKKLHEKSLHPLECVRCHATFDDRYGYYMHNKIHKNLGIKAQYSELLIQEKGSENYTCLFCEKPYTNRNNGVAHVQRHMNVVNGTFQCKICDLRCPTKGAYQIHIKIHENSSADRIAPPKMVEGFHTDYESTSQEPCEKSNLPLYCKTCNVFFNNKTNLKIHLWKSKLKLIQSTIAADGKKLSERIKNPLPCDRSKIVKDKDGFFNCSKCDYKSNKQTFFRSHVRGHKIIELGLYTCDVCQMRFKRKGSLESHKKTHRVNVCFECHKCHEKFATRAELMRHRIVHTENNVSKQFMEKVSEDENGVFTCPFCGKTDTNRNSAYAHFRGHVWDKYTCQICEKRYLSMVLLKRHLETHKKLRYTCNVCNEKFETASAYARHKNTHNSKLRVVLGMDDRYHCTLCDESFPTGNKAYYHYRKHLSTGKGHV